MTDTERPHYLGHRQRLRERFVKNGIAGLANYEMMELVLTLSIPRGDVKPMAKALIEKFSNLRGVLDATSEELSQVKGVGEVTAIALRVIREAAALYLQQSAERQDSLTNPEALAGYWRMKIGFREAGLL